MGQKRNRQESDTRKRYQTIVNAIRKRYPADTPVPVSVLRRLMTFLDIRATDSRTQNRYLEWLQDEQVFGEAVITTPVAGRVRVLPPKQLNIETQCTIAELMQK